MTQLPTYGKNEPNPYRPDLPDSIAELSLPLFDHLREVIETLREQHNVTQAGDSTYSWELLTKLDLEPFHTLGSLGRFYHPNFGIMHARYCKFDRLKDGGGLGVPVGWVLGAESLWTVTDDLSLSDTDFVVGLAGTYTRPKNGMYGWVITNGPNIQSFPIRKRTPIELFDKASWPATGSLGVLTEGSVAGTVLRVDGITELPSDDLTLGYKLLETAPVGPRELQRFDPTFWTCNFPSTMMASLITVGTTLRATADFHKRNDLAGIIWESEDTWDHPLAAYETKKDYRNCTLEFTIKLAGSTPALNDVQGAVMTIEGRTQTGVPKTWFVRLINYRVSGGNTEALIRLNFNSIAGGFAADDPVWAGDIDRMFIGFVPAAFDGTDTQLPGGKVTASMELSNILATGSNSTMLIANGIAAHDLRMTNGFDDTYNLTPARVVRNTEMLGYRKWFNHYVGMSHYMQWSWNAGESRFIADDVPQPLNQPTVEWHRDLSRRLYEKGYQLIISLSYELLNNFCPLSWRQLDWQGNPALSGWSPPSTFLSPCNDAAMNYLKRVGRQFAEIMAGQDQKVHFQVGEPWWWVRFDTLVPCFYDSQTTAKYLADTGVAAPVIQVMTESMTPAKIVFLNWLGDRLAESSVSLAEYARAGFYDSKTYVLVYLPQVLDENTPETKRVNMPLGWAYPAFDILQLEDYTFVIDNRPDLSAAGRDLAESRLGYPRSLQQYFAGFVLNRDAPQIWEYTTNAIRQAFEFGIPEVFIWAYTQVVRDGYVFDLDTNQLFRRWDIPPGNFFVEMEGHGEYRIKKWIDEKLGPVNTRLDKIDNDLIVLIGSQGLGGLTVRVTAAEATIEDQGRLLAAESLQRSQADVALTNRVAALESGGQSGLVTAAQFNALSGQVNSNWVSFTSFESATNLSLSTLNASVGSLQTWRTGVDQALAALSGQSGVSPEALLPTLTSPWINYGAGFLGARYYKTANNVVVITGLIQAPPGTPTTGVTLFTLLPGYRPSETIMFTIRHGGGSGRIDIDSNGNVIMQDGNTAFTSLAGISFVAA